MTSTWRCTSSAAISPQSISIGFSKPALNGDVLPLRVTKFAQAYHQRVEGYATCIGTFRAARRDEAYSRDFCLRARTEGLCRCTAERADKFSPPDVNCHVTLRGGRVHAMEGQYHTRTVLRCGISIRESI
jgi:hypothetical protein